ncbi:MAG: glycosyltransferase family 4 protein [Caldilineaceae bacterium]|nr:glycosyltransferase family 4 protein [Caldilineaceae bacterium]
MSEQPFAAPTAAAQPSATSVSSSVSNVVIRTETLGKIAMAPLRIAHLTATFPPYLGGTGNVCYYSARELARRGHDVHVSTVVVEGAPAQEIRESISIHRLQPLVQVGNAPLIPQQFFYLDGFDIIHLCYPIFGGESATLAGRWKRMPLIITYHQDVHQTGWLGVMATALQKTLGRLTLRSAKKVLFTSADFGKESYVQPMLKGRAAAVGELANGVDPEFFLSGRTGYRSARALWISSGRLDCTIGCCVGSRAHYFKGVNVLLQALTILPTHVKAVIVGDGDLRAHYAMQAIEVGIGDRVMFAGRVSDTNLVDDYRLADITVLPSITMAEALGIVLVELLACATPVIASNLPGVRTVIADGVDGYLVTPGDVGDLASRLDRFLNQSAAERFAMGPDGRRKVEAHYSWERIGDLLEELHAQVTGQSPNRVLVGDRSTPVEAGQ